MASARPLRRRLLFLVLAAGGVLLLASALLSVWLTWRAGPEYFGAPERLLPPDAGLVATWRDLNAFLDGVQNLGALEAWREDEDLAAFLLTDSTWRKLQREKDKARYKFLNRLAGNFVRRWLGQEVTLALAPPPAGRLTGEPGAGLERKSGLLVLARTQVGFEENLAEFVAHVYPELALETRRYRGHKLYRYNAEKSRRAFCYCRFGRTVAVSLRSADWAWIEGVVDRKLGAAPARKGPATGRKRPALSLAHDVAFAQSVARRSGEGLEIFLEPRRLTRTLRALPAKLAESESWAFWFDYFDERLEHVPWATLTLRLENGLRLSSFWKTAGEAVGDSAAGENASQDSPPRVPPTIATLPPETALLLFAESGALGTEVRDLARRMRESEAYAERFVRFDEGWRDALGLGLTEAWSPALQGSTGAAVTGLGGGALLPVPIVQGWWDCRTESAAARLAAGSASRTLSGGGLAPVLLAGLECEARVRRVLIGLNQQFLEQDAPPAVADGATSPTGQAGAGLAGPGNLFEQPLLEELWRRGAAPPVFGLFVNFETGYAHLQRVHAAAALWSKDVRKNVAHWQAILSAARRLHVLRLTAIPRPAGVEIDLLVSVD